MKKILNSIIGFLRFFFGAEARGEKSPVFIHPINREREILKVATKHFEAKKRLKV